MSLVQNTHLNRCLAVSMPNCNVGNAINQVAFETKKIWWYYLFKHNIRVINLCSFQHTTFFWLFVGGFLDFNLKVIHECAVLSFLFKCHLHSTSWSSDLWQRQHPTHQNLPNFYLKQVWVTTVCLPLSSINVIFPFLSKLANVFQQAFF